MQDSFHVRAARLLSALMLLLGGLAAGCGGERESPSGSSGTPGSLAQRGPLTCAEPIFDFGQVWEGALLEHEFVLVMSDPNPGGVALVKADCGCAIPSVEVQLQPGAEREPYQLKSPLPLGARLFVNVVYNTKDKSGPAPRRIQVYGPGGAVRLGLEADVRPWLSIEPPLAKLGLLEETEATSTTYVVQSLGGEPFGLSYEPHGVPEQVSVELVPQTPDGQGRSKRWQARVKLAAGMPRGQHTYPLRLVSDIAIGAQRETHGVSTLLTVNVVGPVSIDPVSLVFGVVQPGETVARSLRLISHAEGFSLPEPKLSFEPVSGDEAFALGKTAQLTWKAVPGLEAWDIQLLLSGLDPAVKDNFLGRLVIQTGHPEQPVLQALVRGVRMPGGR